MDRQDYRETTRRHWTRLISRRRFVYKCLEKDAYIAVDDKKTRPIRCPLS